MSTDTKLSKAQISKIIQSGGLGNLGKKKLEMMPFLLLEIIYLG